MQVVFASPFLPGTRSSAGVRRWAAPVYDRFKLCLKASPVACSSLVCVSNNLELVSLSWRLGYRLFPECALWLHRGAGIRLSCAVAGVCPVGAAVLQTLPWPGQELRLWTEPGINLGSFWPWVH